MSDWWALHNSGAARRGTDQEMPGSYALFQDQVLDSLAPGRLDEMAGRVLHGMAGMQGIWAKAQPVCRVGCNCGALIRGAVASSHNHTVLARELATAGVVLLKN